MLSGVFQKWCDLAAETLLKHHKETGAREIEAYSLPTHYFSVAAELEKPETVDQESLSHCM